MISSFEGSQVAEKFSGLGLEHWFVTFFASLSGRRTDFSRWAKTERENINRSQKA
jgi:hypothetical protein